MNVKSKAPPPQGGDASGMIDRLCAQMAHRVGDKGASGRGAIYVTAQLKGGDKRDIKQVQIPSIATVTDIRIIMCSPKNFNLSICSAIYDSHGVKVTREKDLESLHDGARMIVEGVKKIDPDMPTGHPLKNTSLLLPYGPRSPGPRDYPSHVPAHLARLHSSCYAGGHHYSNNFIATDKSFPERGSSGSRSTTSPTAHYKRGFLVV